MDPAVDPFHPMLRVIERYRHDVHQLGEPAGGDAVSQAMSHLGQPIPTSLLSFLHRWNGAVLFRGALRIRSIAELAAASAALPSVIVFADGPRETDHWAFAPDGQGGAIFGRWTATGGFDPLHHRFRRWLLTMVRILDENIRDERAQLEAHLDADPECGYLLLKRAENLLADGDPDAAREALRKATAVDPDLVRGWELLGDTMMGADRAAARWAYLKALRAMRLPRPYPTLYTLAPTLIRTLGRLFPAGDPGWERELARFVLESVRDVSDYAELDLAEAAWVELARVRLTRGERDAARTTLLEFLDKERGFRIRGPLAEAVLLLASIETELGHHDDAERRLRVLRLAPPPTRARANLVLGRIATVRQEPWAEDILREAFQDLTDPGDRCLALLLLGERHLLHEHLDEAERAFNEASRLAGQIESSELAARATMGIGDLVRAKGDAPAAEVCYREARAQMGEHPELLLRILIRRGDLFRLTRDAERAIVDYERASEGYRKLDLPIREAWARLRLAQMGVEGAIDRAEELFKSADLAAGVAATDALRGDPGRNLDWHLERASEHARARANAQRARPPLTRADADRPERRIGAHRAAIAACNVRVVKALSDEMESLARTLDLSRPRPTDPQLAHYVAATDLLAAHRSYEAAQALLHQLLEVRPTGTAGQALIGALARSPNAALVDGLLCSLEGDRDPNAIAAAIEVLGWRREKTALPRLRELVRPDGNRTVRRAAIQSLGRIGDAVAIDDLLPALENRDLAADASVALLLLGDRQGVDYQAQLLAQAPPNLPGSAGEIVGRYGGPSYLLLLFRTAEIDGPAGIGALQGLGFLGDPRAVPRLVEHTASRNPTRAQVASVALEILTGHHERADESLLRNRWTDWWAQHGGNYQAGVRYRQGRKMDPGLLVDRLSHDDALVRRTSYDELVISSGVRLPFDHDGPYRVQVIHQAAWRRWWAQESSSFVPGTWTFFGEQVG
jgi:tetratricopeptide (TPR) repeat protein